MEKVVYKGKVFRILQKKVTKGEKTITFEIAERAPGVRLIFINKQEQLLLSKEFRDELNSYDYRLPGGKVFDTIDEYEQFLQSGQSIDERVLWTGKKESKEETGIKINDLHIVHIDTLGATVRRDLYYLIVTDYDDSALEQELELGEDISVGWYNRQQIGAMLNAGHISEGRSVAFLYRHILNNAI